MAVTPGPPPFDPNQKQPVLQGANDTDPYVGKPKPMPKPVPQRQAGGRSDGSGFDFAKWKAAQQRPRPTMVLPGQGQGPMPVGTKPLPNPSVKPPASGGRNDGYGWAQGQTIGAKPFWTGPPGTEPAPIDWSNGGAFRDLSTEPGNPEFRNFRGDDIGHVGGNMKPGGMGMININDFDPKPLRPGGPRMGGWNNQLTEGTPEYGDWVRRMKLQHGEDWTPDGGAGVGPSYGGQLSGSWVQSDVYDGMNGAIQRGPGAPGAPPMGTGPGSMGKPQQQGGGGRQPLRPGMEYRPGGGQRPVGGGMQSAPQDGGQSQLPPQYAQAYNGLQGLGRQGGWDPRMGSGYYGAF